MPMYYLQTLVPLGLIKEARKFYPKKLCFYKQRACSVSDLNIPSVVDFCLDLLLLRSRFSTTKKEKRKKEKKNST